jgi:hypothetical protein
MKSKAVLMGDPLHPMLIPLPFAFLTGAFLFDAHLRVRSRCPDRRGYESALRRPVMNAN